MKLLYMGVYVVIIEPTNTEPKKESEKMRIYLRNELQNMDKEDIINLLIVAQIEIYDGTFREEELEIEKQE
tara:strand:- start:415 stop:627 length:213 start_codon:yes stop_codon:yes gene_type:complete